MRHLYDAWAAKWGFQKWYTKVIYACIPRTPDKLKRMPSYCP